MLEVQFEPGPQPADPKIPYHLAIETVLRRLLANGATCRCARPSLRVVVSDKWREGNLRIVRAEACCTRRANAAFRIAPRSLMPQTPAVAVQERNDAASAL